MLNESTLRRMAAELNIPEDAALKFADVVREDAREDQRIIDALKLKHKAALVAGSRLHLVEADHTMNFAAGMLEEGVKIVLRSKFKKQQIGS